MAEGFLITPHPGALALIGDDAAEFLQGQVTNDIERLAPGKGHYAALLTPKGKIRADMRVLRTADNLVVLCEPALLPVIRQTIDTFRIGYFFKTEDMTEYWSLLSLVGEDADLWLHEIGLEPHEVEWDENDNAVIDIHGTLAIRTLLGIDLLGGDAIIATHAADLEKSGVARIEQADLDLARVENAVPAFGRDFDDNTIPEEAGLNERAVSFEKGCYVGQETVARLHYKGKPNRGLRLLQSETPLSSGAPVVAADGKELGIVGTAVVSPERGPIALAVLRREAEPGDTVDAGGTPAKVVSID